MTKTPREILSEAPKAVIDHGDGRIEVLLGDDADIRRRIQRALLAGKVVSRDGAREWWHDEVVLDTSEEGSARYTWDASGDKVLHERVAYRRPVDGELERRVLRRVFKKF